MKPGLLTAAALIADHERKAVATRIPNLDVFNRSNDATEHRCRHQAAEAAFKGKNAGVEDLKADETVCRVSGAQAAVEGSLLFRRCQGIS
jgi:hypothetical protein